MLYRLKARVDFGALLRQATTVEPNAAETDSTTRRKHSEVTKS